MANSVVTACFAEFGCTVEETLADRITEQTFGLRPLVEIARAAYPANRHCTEVGPALGALVLADPEHVLALIKPEWRDWATYVAAAGYASKAEADAFDDRDSHAAMLTGGLVRLRNVRGVECFLLAPVIAEKLLGRLPAEERATALRRIAGLRSELAIMDFGLQAALELGDDMLTAAVANNLPVRAAFGPYRSLSQQLFSQLPLKAARCYPVLGHHLELWGREPIGTTPLHLPDPKSGGSAGPSADDIRSVMTQSYLAMNARRHWRCADESAEVARGTAPTVSRALRSVTSASVREFASLWYLHAGLSCYLAGDVDTACEFYEAGWRYRAYDNSGFATHDLAGKLAFLYAHNGQTKVAQTWLTEYVELPPLGEGNSPDVATWVLQTAELADSLLALDRLNEPAPARYRRSSSEHGHDQWWSFAAWIEARHAIALHRPELVEGIIERGLRTHAADHSLTGTSSATGLSLEQVTDARADASLATGQATRAQAVLRRLPAHSSYGRTTRARLPLLTGDPAAAMRMASTLRTRFDTRLGDQVELYLIEAEACRRLGRHHEALTALRAATRCASRRGDLRAFATVPRALLHEFAPSVHDLGAIIDNLDARGIAPMYPEGLEIIEFSDREAEILQCLATGATLTKIAAARYVSINTVKTHVRTIYAKLGVNSRAQAVEVARRLELL